MSCSDIDIITFLYNLFIFVCLFDIILLQGAIHIYGRRSALFFAEGTSLRLHCRGGIVMRYVTYSELFEFAMFIVGIITLVFTILMFTHKK